MGFKPLMERMGIALDNAMAETFVSTLKAESVSNLPKFPTRQAARTAILAYLEQVSGSSPLVGSLFVPICRENAERCRSHGVESQPIYCNPVASEHSPQYLPFDFR